MSCFEDRRVTECERTMQTAVRNVPSHFVREKLACSGEGLGGCGTSLLSSEGEDESGTLPCGGARFSPHSLDR